MSWSIRQNKTRARSGAKPGLGYWRSLLVGSAAFMAACATAPTPKPSAAQAKAPSAAPPPAMVAPQPPPPKDLTASEEFAAAIQAFEAGNLDGARHGFDMVLAKAPGSLNARFNLGLIAERQGRVEDARGAYEQVLQRDPSHTSSVLNLAALYRKLERGADAIALFEKALSSPERAYDALLLNGLSATYRQVGKLDESEATARRVLERNKDNPGAYKNLAYVAYAREKYRLAELLVGTARKFAEKDPSLCNLLGMVYLKLDERTRALAQFQKAVSLDDKFAAGYINLGALALRFRDYVGAERAFARALELEPDSLEARLSLAWALDGQKGRDSKKGLAAGEAFEKVLATRENLPEAVCGAGWAFAADREGWERAIAFLDRCKAMTSTTEQDKQLITAKVQGLQNMLKAPPADAAVAAGAEGGPKKDGEQDPKQEAATGGAGSLLNQLPQDANAPESESTPEEPESEPESEEETAPDASEASDEGASPSK